MWNKDYIHAYLKYVNWRAINTFILHVGPLKSGIPWPGTMHGPVPFACIPYEHLPLSISQCCIRTYKLLGRRIKMTTYPICSTEVTNMRIYCTLVVLLQCFAKSETVLFFVRYFNVPLTSGTASLKNQTGLDCAVHKNRACYLSQITREFRPSLLILIDTSVPRLKTYLKLLHAN
jgi:hypothetical protein